MHNSLNKKLLEGKLAQWTMTNYEIWAILWARKTTKKQFAH